MIFKRKLPKYGIGDKVRFVRAQIIGCDYVNKGTIWKIHTHLFGEPTYEVFENLDPFSGCNYRVSESEVIEVLAKGNGVASDPEEAAEYAVSVAKAAVEGLKRK